MQELGIGQYHVLGIEYVLATKKKKKNINYVCCKYRKEMLILPLSNYYQI